MDMFDLKPAAPAEVRGEFKPIATRIPGFQVCELMPRLARMADKLSFIRSLVGAASRHDAFQCLSGFEPGDMASLGGRPALGCIVSKLRGSPQDQAPAFVDLCRADLWCAIVPDPAFWDLRIRRFDQTSRKSSHDRSKMA